ncbi:MAG: helix-turn-helix domain-containing protein [Candidatus Tectomicrobia bacterium]|jgi:excisionase family DNA binding protein|nr:helix-turn-helix domain-containing protein [Candidatus Tectomicrobia bacterium]
MRAEDLLTTEQVAEILHMKRDTVSRKIWKREIPAVKVGRRWLVRRETLDALLELPAPQGQ